MGISQLVSSTGGRTQKQQIFTSSGTFTLPTGFGATNPLLVECFLVGGGGGAGASIYDSGNTRFVGGGGGGGGAVTRTFIPLTANAAVTVGDGGAGALLGSLTTSGILASNGGTTSVGAAAPVNMFINPQFLKDAGGYAEIGSAIAIPDVLTVSTITAPIRGHFAQTSGSPSMLQQINVSASTAYTFSIYVRGSSSLNSVAASINWFNASGTFLSTSTGSSANVDTSAWVRFSVTATSPATAAIAVPRVTSASNNYVANAMFEQSGSMSTYVDGDSAGYQWGGAGRLGSMTYASGNFAFAAGGGAGGGYGGNSYSRIGIGQHGGSGGGAAAYLSTLTGLHATGGWGGGAGGSAVNLALEDSINDRAVAADIWATFDLYRNGGLGGNGNNGGHSYSNTYNASNQAVRISQYPQAGAGIEGYGRGGAGVTYFSGNGFFVSTPIFQPNSYRDATSYNGAANTGTGGSAYYVQDSTANRGGNGGSGIAILRWWE